LGRRLFSYNDAQASDELVPVRGLTVAVSVLTTVGVLFVTSRYCAINSGNHSHSPLVI
jgi:hypothetical protein